jgi:hypothetical protein
MGMSEHFNAPGWRVARPLVPRSGWRNLSRGCCCKNFRFNLICVALSLNDCGSVFGAPERVTAEPDK